MQVFKSISLPLEDNYIVQYFISLPKTSKKRLQNDIDWNNKKNPQDQPLADIWEEETIQFLLSCYYYIPVVSLNIKWQIMLLTIKINIDNTDRITLLTTLQ